MVDMIELKLPRFEFYLETGILSLHDGFVVTFFLPGHHQQNSSFIRTAIDRYLSLPGVPKTLGTTDEEGYPLMMDIPSLNTIIDQRLEASLKETSLQVIDSTDGSSSFSIRYFGFDSIKLNEAGWPNAVSGISFTFPTDFLGEAGLVQMFTFSNELAVTLPFSFGYVSPAFIFHEGIGEPGAFKTIRSLSRRYLCLDIPALLTDCFEIGRGPKGAYWGNYLSEPMLKQLGGEDKVKNYFVDQDVRLWSQDNGSMSLYLSRIPLAGDVNRREDISVYQTAFHLFSKLMISRGVPYLMFDDETMLDWIHRFDNKINFYKER